MMKIQANQPTKRNNAQLVLNTTMGAALGSAARYVVPTKSEMGSMKSCADTFFSNASASARGANRSILKYAGIGALVAGVCHLASRLISQKNQENADTFEYSKYSAIIDAPEYACEILDSIGSIIF